MITSEAIYRVAVKKYPSTFSPKDVLTEFPFLGRNSVHSLCAHEVERGRLTWVAPGRYKAKLGGIKKALLGRMMSGKNA